MICSSCGAEIEHVLIDKFQWDGTDRDELTVLEDLDDNCYGIATDHNWTGDELDEDDTDIYDTIVCPKCRKFPFKSKEIQRQEIVWITCWNE